MLLFLLTQATNNRELYERNYVWLFWVNMVVAGVLLLVIVWVARAPGLRLRSGKFGSRLLVKLAAIFALVGVVPGVLIYIVSYQFVSRSIESWFDVKVEGALDAGLSLGRATLDALAERPGQQDARGRRAQLAETPDTVARRWRWSACASSCRANDVMLWSGSGQLIASAGQSRFQLNPGAADAAAAAQGARPARRSPSSRGWTSPALGAVATPASGAGAWCRSPSLGHAGASRASCR